MRSLNLIQRIYIPLSLRKLLIKMLLCKQWTSTHYNSFQSLPYTLFISKTAKELTPSRVEDVYKWSLQYIILSVATERRKEQHRNQGNADQEKITVSESFTWSVRQGGIVDDKKQNKTKTTWIQGKRQAGEWQWNQHFDKVGLEKENKLTKMLHPDVNFVFLDLLMSQVLKSWSLHLK